jgi:hypothetical protein
MTMFTAQVGTPQAAPQDPSKHVNYTIGMVLGVDDFNQEFAYLTGRDGWLARDVVGYGTLSGLQVTIQADARGPQVVVSAGSAINPLGQLIRVPVAQSASLNDWLSANQASVVSHLGAGTSPPSNVLQLSVVLSYGECPTDQVPVPGEPCRTEDQLTVPSRIADDFMLELRFDSPDQFEELALRRYVAWIAQTQITSTASPLSVAAIAQAISSAAGLPDGPPCTPDTFLPPGTPNGLSIRPTDAGAFLRTAFGLWDTQLRPRWRIPGLLQDWTCADQRTDHAADARSLALARLTVPLVQASATANNAWQVTPTLSQIQVDEQQRAYLVQLRTLQEWLLAGWPAVGQRPGAAPQIVAAGIVRGDASRRTTVYNGLYADVAADGQLVLRFNGVAPADPATQYVVNCAAVYGPTAGLGLGAHSPVITFDRRDTDLGGLVMYVTDGTTAIPQATLSQGEFMVEISQYGLGSP